jgi:6-pyruvoyl-tetrahydropterin synthase
MALICSTRRFSFRAVHHLNVGVHREATHGHQYFVELSASPETLPAVSELFTSQILPRLEGHDICQVISPATGEAIVEWIDNEFKVLGAASSILGIALQETRKNRFISRRTAEQLL